MRRKREKGAAAKAKSSPEKKPEKLKRTRSKRRKQSTSDNDSGDEIGQAPEMLSMINKNDEETSTKEDSPQDSQDQVWQVKTAEGSGDGGEIQKLKICLKRPPSTPESGDRSPRSKRRHASTASLSDATSTEGSEEKKKKHRSKRSMCDVSEIVEKHSDPQPKESNQEPSVKPEISSEIVVASAEKDITATDEESCEKQQISQEILNEQTDLEQPVDNNDKKSPTEPEPTTIPKDESDSQIKPIEENIIEDKETDTKFVSETSENAHNPERKRSVSVDKSEILELHAEESKGDISEHGITECDKEDTSVGELGEQESDAGVIHKEEDKVSKNEDKSDGSVVENTEPSQNEIISTNETDVVAITDNSSSKEMGIEPSAVGENKMHDNSESAQSCNEEMVQNGHTNIVINRKRRWGSRPNKLSSQKSITISTDVLKEIIPDVKLVEFEEVIEDRKQYKRVEVTEKIERPVLPKIVIDNTVNIELKREKENEDADNIKHKDATVLTSNRKISIVKETENIAVIRPPSPPIHKQSNILFITNLVRPFTLSQLKNLLQRTGRIAENGFWIDRIKSKCYVIYENEDQAVETRHALHGVTWPVSNPKKLHVDFSTQEEFDKAKANEETDETQVSTIPGTVEDWLREQDLKRERGELEKPWERKSMREWDIGKNEKGKDKEKEKLRKDDRSLEKRRHHTPERSPEPAKKFKKKEEAPAKLLDDLFRKTKTTPCIYWLPLSAETIAIKEEQRRQHMAEHEKRLQELRRTHRRH